MTDLFSDATGNIDRVTFTPTRQAGLDRLAAYAPVAGRAYARSRNFDYGPDQRSNVSCLSPWIRHRLITEVEVLSHILPRHGLSAAEKFVQEVFWRAYFKGWLEHRPAIWRRYQSDLMTALALLDDTPSVHADYTAATTGATGIDGFDDWAQELVATGYLHNHARMWFASIWIFTLRLPWVLGADFFMRHLVDGDPAANTLSWRWVAGLHTVGKTYLATPDNIARFTQGRFRPTGLATHAPPLTETQDRTPIPPMNADPAPTAPYLLLLTEDDAQGAELMTRDPDDILALQATHGRSPGAIGGVAREFATGALQHAAGQGRAIVAAQDWAEPLITAAQNAGTDTIATAYAPVGPVAARLAAARPALADAGIELRLVRRPYDTLCWPHATKGFFGLKGKIPTILSDLGMAS